MLSLSYIPFIGHCSLRVIVIFPIFHFLSPRFHALATRFGNNYDMFVSRYDSKHNDKYHLCNRNIYFLCLFCVSKLCVEPYILALCLRQIGLSFFLMVILCNYEVQNTLAVAFYILALHLI